MYEVNLEKFRGPLDKLLELIEGRKLEITTVNLGQVTGDFLEYLGNNKEQFDSALLADFLVVAAKLVLIKSKALLPELELTEEEEESIKDLEIRLSIYREFAVRQAANSENKSASQEILGLWEAKRVSYSRPLLFALSQSKFFYPAPNATSENMASAMEKLVLSIQEIIPIAKKIEATIVSLESKMKELLLRFKAAALNSFKNLTQKRTRSEVIVMFLAILHLLKDKSIEVEQESHFGDIMIKTQEQNSENKEN